jgi:hypothetical protein
MPDPVQPQCPKAAAVTLFGFGLTGAKSGQPSGLRQAKATNNVTIWGFVRQFGRNLQRGALLGVRKLLQYKEINGFAAKVTSGVERGTRLANSMAVPRQGYGRN